MKNSMRPIFVALFFSITSIAHSQIDTLFHLHSSKQQIGYHDFIVVNNNLFALNDSGQIVVFKLNKINFLTIINPPRKDKFTSLYKSKENKLFITTTKGRVYNINSKSFRLKNILKIKYSINSLCYNSKNKLFLILYNAVYDPIYKRAWNEFPEYHSGLIYMHDSCGISVPTEKYFAIPDYSYLDINDIWWMVKDEGEWGKELYFFDTKTSEIYSDNYKNIDLKSVSPRALLSDIQGNTIIINAGWQCWSDTLNFIKISFDGVGSNYTCIIRDNISVDSTTTVKIIDGIINVIAHPVPLFTTFSINTAAFNKNDTCIYISTSKGLYKTKWVDENYNLVPILLTKQTFQEIKIDFTNKQQLIFLTREGYLGLYQNNKFVLFR